jgi:hypothetical protein
VRQSAGRCHATAVTQQDGGGGIWGDHPADLCTRSSRPLVPPGAAPPRPPRRSWRASWSRPLARSKLFQKEHCRFYDLGTRSRGRFGLLALLLCRLRLALSLFLLLRHRRLHFGLHFLLVQVERTCEIRELFFDWPSLSTGCGHSPWLQLQAESLESARAPLSIAFFRAAAYPRARSRNAA